LATAVLAPQRPALVRFLDRYFYFSMSLLIAAVVAWGFGHTVNQNLIHASPIPPFILTIHAIVFPGWVLFFILQSALVRSHNVKLHRTVGWFGVALAVAIVVVGFLTARGMDRFHLTQPDDSFNTRAFMIIQLTDLVCFAVPFALAIYWRRRPEYHRRSVLIASCALTNAAFARFPHIPLIWSPAGVVFLILLGAVRDFLVNRRVHKVYLYALPLYIAIEILAVQTYTHGAHWWLRIADQLLR
jgi:hypothetical protein